MLSTSHAFAGVHKWLDENNHVHYSDQPPPANAKARKLAPIATGTPAEESDANAESDAATSPKTFSEREAELRKSQQAKQQEAEKAAQEQENREIEKKNCDNAQHNLKVLQAGGRIVDLDEKGERYFLTDEQLQQRVTKAQEDVKARCK
jgi:hypothetical protein